MGRKGGKKFGKGGAKGDRRGQRADWQDFARANENYERYYNELAIVPEEEREVFWETLRRDLPNSFRFTGSKGHALAVQQRLKDFYIPEITSIQYEGNYVEPPKPIPWYPDQLAWAMTTPKTVIRRFPPFASFQKFLVAETDVGNISRQEVVSMIPPLLIDTKPGMTVLDMCAAPGSKSAQLMEMVHAGEEDNMGKVAEAIKNGVDIDTEAGLDDDGRSTGLLIANDSDYKRAHMLVHQMKRLNSPNLIVTNHDATLYPSIKLPSAPAEDGKPVKNRYLKFDRILADVPCSGDGTPRKNMNVWKDWTPSNALGLYLTQVRILVRALQMLKVGGRVVYSTCSLNPVENEAAVASAIDRCGGPDKVQIVDCSKELPELKRYSGLHSWKVMDKQGRIWNSWQEVEEQREKEGIEGLGRLCEGMFPSTGEGEKLPLDRCMRIYPHQQDTGGFFITVLEKKAEIKAKPEESKKIIPKSGVMLVVDDLEARAKSTTKEQLEKLPSLDDLLPAADAPHEEHDRMASTAEFSNQSFDTPTAPSPAAKRSADEDTGSPNKKAKVAEKDPASERAVHWPPPGDQAEAADAANVVKIPEPAQPTSSLQPQKRKPNQPYEEPFKYLDPNHEELESVFNFYHINSRFPRDRFMVRNAQGHPAKSIYYTTTLARDILVENEGKGIKFVHCGVKMFVKQDVQKEGVCRWRIQTDGLSILESWVGPQRVVKLYKKETLRKLLIEMFPKVNDGGWKELGELGEWARDVDMGCCVLRIEPTNEEDGLPERMVLPLWRSLYSLQLMLPKEERRAMLLRLYNDDTPLVNTTQKRQQDARDARKAAAVDAAAVVEAAADSAAKADVLGTEEDAVKKESLALGQLEEDAMASRETFNAAGDEKDVMNETV